MKTPRKHYDQEFKRMIVELYKSGKTARSISEEFGIRVEFVSRWKREMDQYQEGSFSGNGNPRMTEEQAEITRLRKELREAQIERDILKKAVSIFSRNDSKSSLS